MRTRKQKNNLILGVVILLLMLVVIYSGFRILQPTVFYPENETSTKTIERNGKKYFPKQDITTFLILGIDQEGPVKDSGSYNNDGENDVVMLAVFDETDKTYSIISLNRDTMLEMPTLGLGGKPADEIYGQLALSHTYGSGLKDSCELTKRTVSEFLYGVEIDYYVSLNMDAIGILNDAVGGVTVNVTDDFSAIDPTITKGKITLNAKQALEFVRTRKDVGDQMNVSRMSRHEEYMKGFLSALDKKLDQSSSFAFDVYEDVSDYAVTDCSMNVLATLVSRFSDYALKEIVTPEGENVKGNTYMEFHVDEDKLDALIIRMLYDEKK